MLAMVVSEKSLMGQWILIFKNFELKYTQFGLISNGVK